MRKQITDSSVTIWLNSSDTYNWATRPGASWPCSDLRGNRLMASFNRNGLCDYTVNGQYADVSGDELSAICADFLADVLPKEHPCHFIAVGQFQTA